ncbi:Complex 1 LYR protein [Ostreococcus tauri]|uniref:Complex 1 LYR protein n=1 Tax=Ostreococcus tauri TaxID=70448 RepID=Q015K9_OSTTA|nr:Complex 1 LYR protein [Ostreococcus tauri]OUS47471.1 complex 1 family protein [Ostreococcus tauri]CAL54420.1 Complex 1 LYR protein [Ostreococcus tauri]|eukprot:XP_003080253.1 Complex 1 LYR protein [Ostreococcus tauri]
MLALARSARAIRPPSSRAIASTSSTRLNEDDKDGGKTIEIIEANLDRKKGEFQKKDETHVRAALLTTRKEALSLYRAVIRASVFFVWRDERGRQWRDVIRESARKEFEAGRRERDPEMVNRMLLMGRDAVDKAVNRFLEKREAIQREEDACSSQGGEPSPS